MNEFFKLQDAEQFSFYKFPKALFLEGRYSALSPEAKLLYSLMLDRTYLSRENKWTDESGYVYIYFSQSEAGKLLHFGKDKTCRLYSELEKHDLIFRKRQGLGKADMIYVKKLPEFDIPALQNTQNTDFGNLIIGIPDFGNSGRNNTESNKTYFTDTNLSICGYDADTIREIIEENIDYEILAEKYNREELDGLVTLMTDEITATAPSVRIAKSEYPRDVLRNRLLSLNQFHIEYLLERMSENTVDVRNIRAYMLTSLFNAPTTIDSYYNAKVRHDMPELAN